MNKMQQIDADKQWMANRDACGWELPELGPRWTRWPIIRTLRALAAAERVESHYTVGPGRFGLRTGYDEWVVYAIARGWC